MDELLISGTGQLRRLRRGTRRRAFTMVEVMIVVIVVGILAAMVVPQFGGVTADAKAAALQGSVGGVRSAIAGYRAKQVLAGAEPFPTLVQITTLNTVVQGEFPANPFNAKTNAQAVTQAQAEARTVVNEDTVGWNYYVNNTATPPTAVFYANSSAVTTVSNGTGGFKTANQL